MKFVLDATPFRDDATIVSSLIAGALAGSACGMGSHESIREMGRETMFHCGTFTRSGHCSCGTSRLYFNHRSRADRISIGEDLSRPQVALFVAGVQGTYQGIRKMGKKWGSWCTFASFLHKPGQQWYEQAKVWQGETIETSVSTCWQDEYKEGWILISDQPAGKKRVHEYAKRMRVEATFQDSKNRGWKIEASQVRDRARLDRLLMALFLAVWWISHLAASCIHNGHRARFDRHDRRDKSIFRLGHLWLLDILRRVPTSCLMPAILTSCLPFRKKPSGWAFSLRF